MSPTQPEFLFRATEEDPLVSEFRQLLHLHGWLTRAKIHELKGWSERQVRMFAEALGADVVRSPRYGFKLTDDLTDEELGAAKEAADFSIHQGTHMQNYGMKLKRKLHGRLGA